MRVQHIVATVAAGMLAATLVPSTALAVSEGSVSAIAPVPSTLLAVTPACAAPGPTDVIITLPAALTTGAGQIRVVDETDDAIVATVAATGGAADQPIAFATDLDGGYTRFEVQRQASSALAAQWAVIGRAVVGAPCPAITVIPNPLDRGTVPAELTFDLIGFPPRYDAVLRVEDSEFATVRIDRDGRATHVQAVSVPPPCGAYDITATVETEPPPVPHTAATVLDVLCPTLTADPATVGQAALPTSTLLTGAGWARNTDVAIGWDKGNLVTRTDDRGRLSVQMPLPERDCGPFPVTATEAAPKGSSLSTLSTNGAAGVNAATPQTASTSVTITCVEPPTLIVSPAVTGPGSVTQVFGTRLPAGSDVLLVWTDGTGRPLPGVTRAVVAADGTMRSPVLVLPRSATGARQLVLLDAGAPGSPAVVAAPALIVNNSVEPGRDRLLSRR